jgi:hypothetical protein
LVLGATNRLLRRSYEEGETVKLTRFITDSVPPTFDGELRQYVNAGNSNGWGLGDAHFLNSVLGPFASAQSQLVEMFRGQGPVWAANGRQKQFGQFPRARASLFPSPQPSPEGEGERSAVAKEENVPWPFDRAAGFPLP